MELKLITNESEVPESWQGLLFGRVPKSIAASLNGHQVAGCTLKDNGPKKEEGVDGDRNPFHTMGLERWIDYTNNIGAVRATVQSFLQQGSTVKLLPR